MISRPYVKSPFLKPWLVKYIESDGNSKLAHAVKIIEGVSGPDEEGNLVRDVTDGEIYLKAIITGKAVKQMEKEVDAGIPSWNRALLLVRKHSLKFEPDIVQKKSGFALVIEEFKIWDFLCGFDLKKDIRPGFKNSTIQHKILVNWNKWKNAEYLENTNSVTGSQMLSLLAEMGQMTQTQDDSGLNPLLSEQSNQDLQQNLSTTLDLNTDKGSLSILHKSVEKFQSKAFNVFDFLIDREEENILDDIKEWKKDYMPTPSLGSDELSEEPQPFPGSTLISDKVVEKPKLHVFSNMKDTIWPSRHTDKVVQSQRKTKGKNSSTVSSSALDNANSGLSNDENFGFDSPQVESLQFSNSPSSESDDPPNSPKLKNAIGRNSIVEVLPCCSLQSMRSTNLTVQEVKKNKNTYVQNKEGEMEVIKSKNSVDLDFGNWDDFVTNKEKQKKSAESPDEDCNDNEDIVTSTQPFTYKRSPPPTDHITDTTVGPEYRSKNISRKRFPSMLSDPKPSKCAKMLSKSASSESETSDNQATNSSNFSRKSTNEEIYQSTQRTISKKKKTVPNFTLSPIKNHISSTSNQNSRSLLEEAEENVEIISDLAENQRLQKLASISSKSLSCNSDNIVEPTISFRSSKALKSPTKNQIKSVPVCIPESQDVIFLNEVKTDDIPNSSSPSKHTNVKTPRKLYHSTNNKLCEMNECVENDIIDVIVICNSQDLEFDEKKNSPADDSRTKADKSNQDSYKNMPCVFQNIHSESSNHSVIMSNDMNKEDDENRSQKVKDLAPNTKTWQELLLSSNQTTRLQQEILNFRLSKSSLKEIHKLFTKS